MRYFSMLLLAVTFCLVSRSAHADSTMLSIHDVNSVVDQNDRAIQACGKLLGAHADTLAVTVRFTVDAFGHVTSVAPETGNARLAACITKVVHKMEFPRAQMDSTLAMPFLFNPHR